MKKVFIKIMEIVCVLCLCLFLVWITSDEDYSDKKLADIEKTVVEAMNTDSLQRIKKNKIKEEFGFDFASVEEYVYYAADEVMDVRELMIIKLKPDTDGEDIYSLILQRVKDKQTLFEGYAPEQGALLKNHILRKEKGFIFYAVGDDAREVYAAFSAAIN